MFCRWPVCARELVSRTEHPVAHCSERCEVLKDTACPKGVSVSCDQTCPPCSPSHPHSPQHNCLFQEVDNTRLPRTPAPTLIAKEIEAQRWGVDGFGGSGDECGRGGGV